MRPLLPSARRRSLAGFTLIELLIVIVIIGILVAIAVPAYLRYTASANDRDAQAALQTAYKAAVAGDTEVNSSRFPIASTVVNDVKADEPAANVARGDCIGGVATAPVKQVLVDPSSTSTQITMCVKSASGAIWKLTGPLTGAPTVTDGSTVALTMSGPGSLITDAVRAEGSSTGNVAGDSYDGLANDSSTGVWETTTNLVGNGGLEGGSAGWNVFNSTSSLSQDASTSEFGSASLRVDTINNLPNSGVFYNYSYTAGLQYTLSAWVKGPAGISVAVGYSAADGPNVAMDGTWRRLTYTFTAASGDNRIYLLQRTGSVPSTFWVDGVQIEQKPYATPYVETNGAPKARTASRIQVPAAIVSPAQGWFAARVRPSYPSAAPPPNARVFWLAADATGTNRLSLGLAPNVVQLIANNGSTEIDSYPFSWSAGDLITLVAAWTASHLYVSVNGSPFQSLPRTQIPSGTLTFDLGSQQNSTGWFDGDFLWFATGTGTLTSADAATISSWGSSDPKHSSFPSAAQAAMVWDGTSSSGSLK